MTSRGSRLPERIVLKENSGLKWVSSGKQMTGKVFNHEITNATKSRKLRIPAREYLLIDFATVIDIDGRTAATILFIA